MSAGCSRENTLPEKSKPASTAGKELRQLILTTSPQQLKFAPDDTYPVVYGVITDWHIDEDVASILSLKDGSASLYTTSTFGIIGGHGHESVRQAAERCVKIASEFLALSSPAPDYPYPQSGKICFYLLTYDGVRVFAADEIEVYQGTHRATPLFAAAQDVLTALRLVTDQK
jgi:hypothetical protein